MELTLGQNVKIKYVHKLPKNKRKQKLLKNIQEINKIRDKRKQIYAYQCSTPKAKLIFPKQIEKSNIL